MSRKVLLKTGLFLTLISVLTLCVAGAFAQATQEISGMKTGIAGRQTGRGIAQHTIVSLVPLTGWASEYGENSAEAARLAAADVNSWLRQEGKSWRLKLMIQDTQLNASVARQKVQQWSGRGVKFFAGPFTSWEAGECLGLANDNKVLLVSQSSTSPALAIEDDWLYRFCPSDAEQGPVLTRLAGEKGVEHMIFVSRQGYWADSVQAAAEDAAWALGIATYSPEELRYVPEAVDFAELAEELNISVTDLVDNQGVDIEQIGVCIIAFGEMDGIMTAIAGAGFPWSEQVAWLGNDRATYSWAMSETAKTFAANTGFTSLMLRPEKGPKYEYVGQHVYDTLGREPDQSAYIVYDIIWSLAKAIDQVGYDSERVKEVLPETADAWTRESSAGGHVELNEAGDRKYADFDFWVLNKDILEWEIIGWYDSRETRFIWE